MSLSKDQVKQIATLAKLKLPKEKEELYQQQLTKILDYMNKLNELDTTNIEPLYSPCPNTSILREDMVQKNIQRKDILQNAPATDDEFFIVPKII
ncbi:Asp-tRNA(Asn)/Glu-tRNA(Gln) amidotransferase subunit GatC [Desulfonauticus submarinus]